MEICWILYFVVILFGLISCVILSEGIGVNILGLIDLNVEFLCLRIFKDFFVSSGFLKDLLL